MLTNATRFVVQDVASVDHAGRDVVLVVLKTGFSVDAAGRLGPPERRAVIVADDVPYKPDDPCSSLRYPSDLGMPKVGTDVVVVGDAVSRHPVKVVDVAVRVRDRTVPLRVHGERVFYRGLGGALAVGPAAEFERKPVVYEKAYGGVAADWSVVEERNWSGVGVAKSHAALVDKPAPQIEHPEHPHTSAGDHHAPVGFGAIRSHWAPRKGYYGTCDAAWAATRMPVAPVDFDRRFCNVAHPSLQFDKALAPGEAVAVLGMSLEGLLRFELPALRAVVRALFADGSKDVVHPAIDTVLIEPSERRVEMSMRATLPLGRGKRVLREVRVDTDV